MQDSTTSSLETEKVETTTTAAEKPALETLRDLFNEEAAANTPAAEPERASKGETGESQKKVKPKALKELAERLELKPEDLYAIDVPMSDGKSSMTLGQLKDAAQAQGDFTIRELQFEEDRQRREGEMLRAQNELRELVSALPPSAVKPEVLEAVRKKHETILNRERAKTLEVIPEWQDEAKRTEELAGIVEHLEGYGFPKGYLQSVYDHRTLRYIRENWLRQQRISKALGQVTAAKPSTPGKSRASGAAPKPFTKTRSQGPSEKGSQLRDFFSNS